MASLCSMSHCLSIAFSEGTILALLFLHAFATCTTVQQVILNVRVMVALYVFFVTCVAKFCTMRP